MTFVLSFFGFIVAVIGVMACFLPIIPGPPVSFLSLLILSYAKNWETFSTAFLISFGILSVILVVLDNFMPALGAKKYGATKLGMWGSMAGMVLGLFFFPPWGVFVGTFLGAVTGEVIAGKRDERALKIGWGVFIGTLMGIGLKFAYSSLVLAIYVFKML